MFTNFDSDDLANYINFIITSSLVDKFRGILKELSNLKKDILRHRGIIEYRGNFVN